MQDAELLLDGQCLICFDVHLNADLQDQLTDVQKNFCGAVLKDSQPFEKNAVATGVVFCGNVGRFRQEIETPFDKNDMLIISDLSYNFEQHDRVVSVGEIPINIHGVGLYFRKLFGWESGYFDEIVQSHRFQKLTESNKPGSSYRTGIYLSKVEPGKVPDELRFDLLRCSTNLDGPTENFRKVDDRILAKVNEQASRYFSNAATFNHVLAQIYENSSLVTEKVTREKKARISSHSDKTKDMPENGMIAFCTFYDKSIDEISKPSKTDRYDLVYKNASVLTRLRFRLKDNVRDKNQLADEFTISLYPNSAFMIPLSTNRLYTHAIVPPNLPVSKIPTRLGYVVRCSNAPATHMDGKTYLTTARDKIPLESPSDQDRLSLKRLYFQENTSDQAVDYGIIPFSMNQGDYKKPSI